MDNNIDILNDEEIIIVDADEIFNVSEITLEDHDLEDLKDAEAQVAKFTSSVALAAKMQKKALEELEGAEEVRQSIVRRLAAKYDIPANKDWQINLGTGKIVLVPERD